MIKKYIALTLMVAFPCHGFEESAEISIQPIEISDADYLVDDVGSMLTSLSTAVSGDIVFIADGSLFDLSAYDEIVIPSGVTLAGSGQGGGKGGPTLYSTTDRIIGQFKAGGPGVRVTGIRLFGPDPDRRTELMTQLIADGLYYSEPTSLGLLSNYDDFTVDRSEVTGFGYAAVRISGGANNGRVYANYLHHNQRHGLGYGVVVHNANAVIERNVFDWNRHSIASSGTNTSAYEARFNLVGENSSSHAFDMHEGTDNGDGTFIAGKLVAIHHNVFLVKDAESIRVRGNPIEGAWIYSNCFYNGTESDNVVFIKNTPDNLNVYDNVYSGCTPLVEEFRLKTAMVFWWSERSNLLDPWAH